MTKLMLSKTPSFQPIKTVKPTTHATMQAMINVDMNPTMKFVVARLSTTKESPKLIPMPVKASPISLSFPPKNKKYTNYLNIDQ